jgi:hypothetical protein
VIVADRTVDAVASNDYFEEIESLFTKRRGTPFVVNAKDWALMKKWHEEGVPLPIVLEAIDTVFDRHDAKGKSVNGLSFCKHAVKELWDERRQLTVGSETTAPEENVEALLETLAARLESSSDPLVNAYASRIRALTTEKTVPRIEEQLIELEQELIDTLLAASPQSDSLRARANELSSGADEKTRARTEIANLRRLVREAHELPRLSLF